MMMLPRRQPKVFPVRREVRRKVEVLGERHVLVELLEAARERHRRRLGDLLESLQVDHQDRRRGRDEVPLVHLLQDDLL